MIHSRKIRLRASRQMHIASFRLPKILIVEIYSILKLAKRTNDLTKGELHTSAWAVTGVPFRDRNKRTRTSGGEMFRPTFCHEQKLM